MTEWVVTSEMAAAISLPHVLKVALAIQPSSGEAQLLSL